MPIKNTNKKKPALITDSLLLFFSKKQKQAIKIPLTTCKKKAVLASEITMFSKTPAAKEKNKKANSLLKIKLPFIENYSHVVFPNVILQFMLIIVN
ncbi:hypothetical protein [Sinanaerobacter sp. ZZT-01]|uniref:hypothetical protein n=1 Tax=Sinanaerobacter sp. ZZT-01 TaxID=3111540 RepID=UPI002D78CD7B|nr:hypothetical protein [Sinanaerobacter sp. ZZT-01]WRR95148.1 hypothetical protein U5921_10830 [Sinanaerobacter sp. ZZT-01]